MEKREASIEELCKSMVDAANTCGQTYASDMLYALTTISVSVLLQVPLEHRGRYLATVLYTLTRDAKAPPEDTINHHIGLLMRDAEEQNTAGMTRQ